MFQQIRYSKFVNLSVVTVCLLAAAAAQEAPQEPQQTLSVTTRLIELSVVAETEDGRPAFGLHQEDFTLQDNGQQQKIAFFSVESTKGRRPPSGAVPPNVFSNRFERLGSYPVNATVVLFDALNTQLTDQVYARKQIIEFLEQLRPDDLVAVYVVGRGPRVLQDFNGDPAGLLETLANFKGAQDPSLDAPLYDPSLTPGIHFDSWLGELNFNLVEHFDRDRAFRTARSLVAIARHLERLPGRKNLIWVSGSFPLSVGGDSIPLTARAARGSRARWPEQQRVVRALTKANLAVYPVDARGLLGPEEFSAERTAIVHQPRLAEQAKFSTMRTLAERTGGRAFYNSNDLAGAFRRAADDSRLTYVLGYYPSDDNWDGKFRKTRVEVERPDVKLHYRRGYFALPDEPKNREYREETLEAAMFSPVEASGLGLTVRADLSERNELDLFIGVDPRDITFQPKESEWECELDIWLVQLDRREKHLDTIARTNKLRLGQLDYERIMRTRGLVLPEKLKPSKKALLVRVMVRDVDSGTLGSVTIPMR
jgi:VWFA-related protein